MTARGPSDTVTAMSTELTALPKSFAAGTTVSYRKRLADYPASAGWTLTLHLAGAAIRTFTAAADGDDFVVSIPAAQTTEGFTPGLYRWAERVEDESGNVYEVASGRVNVLVDLTRASESDHQEWLERMVTLMRQHIEGRLPAGMESYQVAGRAVSKIPIKEALGLLTAFETKLHRLRKPGSVSRTVYVTFDRPGDEG